MSKTDCYHKITIKLKEPILKDGLYITYINIPCGKCERCIQRRKIEWGFRMETEMNDSKTSYFVTLTYDPKNVPYNKYGQKTLKPKHLQKFFKRLRQNQKRTKPTIEHIVHNLKQDDKIKYYSAGEYGEEKQRPHYHAIIFNASYKTIMKSWKKGNVHIVPANRYTISYVMKYLDKRLGNEKIWNKEPEYNTMSEGIGESYVTKNKTWHKRNIDILYVTNKNGYKIPMPKYYRDKIFTEDEKIKQVLIVEILIKTKEQELINEVGQEAYNRHRNLAVKESKKRFAKTIKKRNVD